MQPLFSIIITTYNRSQLLPRAIHSVLQQTFTDFELIIVDDHSTDTTKDLVAEFSDKRIVYVQQPENKGVSTARNTGIQQAKGEYICFLDDDDEYFPNFLKEIYLFLEKKQQAFIGLIWTGIAKIYAPNNIGTKKEKIETELFTLDNEKKFLTHAPFSGITFHRICFERVGVFNSDLQVAEDIDMVIRTLAAGMNYAAIPKVLIKIHIHEYSSLSRSIQLTHRIGNLERFLLNHDKFLNQHLLLWLCWHANLVGDYYHTGNKQQARKLIWRLFKKKWYYSRAWELLLRFELIKPLKSVLLKLFRP
ncbi:MAG: glycosyltransferase [Rickettsiella sp.]|nr:glycosyltransferase [Rickettsiella sp.]